MALSTLYYTVNSEPTQGRLHHINDRANAPWKN